MTQFTIKYDSTLQCEGSYTGQGHILIGKKFFKLRTRDQQVSVILHEIGHELSDRMLKDLTAFDLADNGAFGKKDKQGYLWGINGARTPGENVAEGYATLILDPLWLKANYPIAYTAIKKRATLEKMPLTKYGAERLLIAFLSKNTK